MIEIWSIIGDHITSKYAARRREVTSSIKVFIDFINTDHHLDIVIYEKLSRNLTKQYMCEQR